MAEPGESDLQRVLLDSFKRTLRLRHLGRELRRGWRHDYYGRKYGLPKAISGHNSHHFWGPGDYTGSCLIIFGDNSSDYIKLFGDVTVAATISSLHATPGEQNLKVYICRKPIAPLSELWPHFKMII